jgi:hypothetical protein
MNVALGLGFPVSHIRCILAVFLNDSTGYKERDSSRLLVDSVQVAVLLPTVIQQYPEVAAVVRHSTALADVAAA